LGIYKRALYFWTSQTKNTFSMALLNMQSTVSPISGLAISTPSGSALITYNSDAINWPTLASQSGIPAWSQFQYTNANQTVGIARVKHTVANIRTAAGASTVS
jgi:hypothetical protein